MEAESTTKPTSSRLRLIIAGGGTGGHISPAIAVLEELRERGISLSPLWIGSRNGFESEAAAELRIPFRAVHTGKLRRYVSIHTLFDVARFPAGVIQSAAIINAFKPHVIFATGGFVSVPPVIGARLWRRPAVTHEQTATLGLATKINARLCDVTALSYAYTEKPTTRRSGSIVVTGNPVRSALLNDNEDGIGDHFDLAGDRPLVYVTGGAQGASAINRAVANALPLLLDEVEIVHQCGPDAANGDYSTLLRLRNELPFAHARRYHPVEWVGEELRSLYAAAELVVGRAGAGTVAELAALGLPSILIPLPGAGEQVRNARLLVDAGAAIHLPEDELSERSLARLILETLTADDQLAIMRSGAQSAAPREKPAARLVDEILALAQRGGWQPDTDYLVANLRTIAR